MFHQERDIHQHADGNEKQHAEQVTHREHLVKRFLAVIGTVQQNSRHECAERECQAHLVRKKTDSQADDRHAKQEQLL